MPKDKHQCLFLKSHEDYRLRGFLTRGGTPHMKGVGMLIGNFELNP